MSNIFIISGPSGAGEDSVIEGLKKIFELEKIVTTTTRAMRPGEQNGREYYFISKEEFQEGIKNNIFFEWTEEENGQLYGGTYEEVEKMKNSNKIGIWKLDYQGAIAAKKLLPSSISIFIYIPMELIRERLKTRGNHSEKFIKNRLEYAKGWFNNRDIYDYEVENKQGKLAETIEKVANIIKKEAKIK